MAGFLRQYWISDGTGTTRRQRRSCEYDAYVPDNLMERAYSFAGDVAADIADAEAAVRHLNAVAEALADTEALARILLRAESVASSRIEGLSMNARRLLGVDAAAQFDAPAERDVTAEEIVGNINAMAAGVATGASAEITPGVVLELHRLLLQNTSLQAYAGTFRKEQNWIGGNGYNPCGAAFVPPPPEMVPGLMNDLCAFCNGDDLPAVAQAAIAHAQFETIHPFVDGNGRVGRALIHLVLRRRGLAPRAVPPVSLALATLGQGYADGLTRFRYVGEADSTEAAQGLDNWVSLFAGACIKAVSDAEDFEARVADLKRGWRERLNPIRKNSTLDLAVDALVGAPVINAAGLAKITGRSFEAANQAIEQLVDASVLTPVDNRRRNRVFEARKLIDEFTRLERQSASPSSNTRIAPPVRPVPGRPA